LWKKRVWDSRYEWDEYKERHAEMAQDWEDDSIGRLYCDDSDTDSEDERDKRNRQFLLRRRLRAVGEELPEDAPKDESEDS
jgi:hypothetical protein